jgi:glycosyltransferase involved in cell wall biosynthesis
VNSPDLGWVVSPDQPEELSDALNAVLSLEPARLEEMRRQALRRVQESFDIDASNQIILDLCGA